MAIEGWWWPMNGRKAHYMVEGQSLCRKWGCLGTPRLEQGPPEADNPDHCAQCKRRLLARRR